MKINQYDNYSDTKEALKNLTEAYFKTGDIKIKNFRDELESYLNETETNEEEIDDDAEIERVPF